MWFRSGRRCEGGGACVWTTLRNRKPRRPNYSPPCKSSMEELFGPLGFPALQRGPGFSTEVRT
eukprot:7840962-Pyramimonas_sp.AAC.1